MHRKPRELAVRPSEGINERRQPSDVGVAGDA